ncbi:hypothetical protein E4U42_007352 [Claviceps africana]|uniref:DNA polymerase eta n=1 Tax=Claviceps africana TaxID=83212 RepID=A0A8K0JBI6_9HYPO|nr:hypothetical protein E4U42_007352 [Claviceps africana]
MSSSSSPVSSSPDTRAARRSQFTYRQLSQLASFATSNPLRVVAHVDLDAFYAQCEMVRLGVPEDQPLAVQQWQGLIAINYPARSFGIGRHCNVTEAKKLCPDLIAQHVATWREGDDKWAYRDDAAANIATDKVSLDPYRLESRKILAVIRDSLPRNLQKVEKASIDEVFLDLSAHVHAVLLERFPELCAPPPYNDVTEKLPLPSITALDWQADALVDLDEEQESQDPDWDDVAILIGSEIVRSVRAKIREQLGYTCSAGIASNKMISKLGSGFKKPNSQTVVRSRAVQVFLADFKVTKIRNLGGKLGDQVVSTFKTDIVKELLAISSDRMRTCLGEETGLWLHNTIRGIDVSEVNSRTQIKSMLSAKSFRPSINTEEQAVKWLRIFVGDIFSRLVEEGVLDNKRRPRSINLHHRHAGHTRSRQGPIPTGKAINEDFLFHLAKELLGQIVSEGNVWPCANLSLSVGGFEDGVKGNLGIDAFLVKNDPGTYPRSRSPSSRPDEGEQRSYKKPRKQNSGIQRFLSRESEEKSGETYAATTVAETPCPNTVVGSTARMDHQRGRSITGFPCRRCDIIFDDPQGLQSHQDWHMAKDLHDEERVGQTSIQRSQRPAASHNSNHKGLGPGSKRHREGKLEPGQKKLNFG